MEKEKRNKFTFAAKSEATIEAEKSELFLFNVVGNPSGVDATNPGITSMSQFTG